MNILPTVIILEGNISAGKTSLARDLGNLLDYHVFFEPTITNPYIEKFYADPPKYALVMQIWLLKQRFRTYISALKYVLESGRGVILDRSVFSDWVFAEKNKIDKNITEEGFQEYLEKRDMLLAHLPIPQITVYLDVSPSECYRRVHHLRGRDFEGGIPLAYLAGLDECYHAFLKNMEAKGSRVISIPWNSFGNSHSVAQLIKSQAANLKKLDEIVDVAQLTNHIYQNPFVLGVLAETEQNDAGTKESEFLEDENKSKSKNKNKQNPSSSPSPSLPTTLPLSIPSPSPSPTSPAPSTKPSPSKNTTPTKFSPAKTPVPISPPLIAR